MSDAGGAVFVDLDRTLIRSASGPVFHEAMVAEGVLPAGRHLPGDQLMYAFYNRFGESVPFIGLARAAAAVMRDRPADATRRAGKRAVEFLVDLVQPWALEVLAAHRAKGRPLVLATTSPIDLVSPLADTLGFDGVVATRYAERDGRYTGRLDGSFIWGWGKRAAVSRWAVDHHVDLAQSHAYSDSLFDVPLLDAVGHPHPLNADPRLAVVAMARRWPLEHWDRAPGIPSLLGLEPYHLVRPFFRPEAFPYARFDIQGLDHVPLIGPVLLVSNHRSYFDVAAIGLVAARLGRPVRFMAKKELFDAPIVGSLARALGGIEVERGSGSSDPMRRAAAALRAGEVVIVLPQGTIPRGEHFFNPVLRGHTGAARLAAETGAPVIPIGLWGTEQVWPRSSKVPNMAALRHPPRVTVTVGPPVGLGLEDAVADTATLMGAIVDLLPDEARVERIPTPEELGSHPTFAVTVSTRPTRAPYSGRASAAVEALTLTNRLSRVLGRGSGTVAGGRVGLAIDPSLLSTLAQDRRVALVSGTNGKTTTTRMVVAALTGPGSAAVATNDTGANMPAGHVSAMAGTPPGTDTVLEVDEGYLPRLVDETRPRVIVLLNLSRDQLDRISEVRMLAERWRRSMEGLESRSASDGPGPVVVANADDPMVVWAASPAPRVQWVGAGQVWHNDAVGCPACGGGITFGDQGEWGCDRCDFARPTLSAWLDGSVLVTADGSRLPVVIGLPGRFNRANAVMASIAAPFMAGPDHDAAPGGPPLTTALSLSRLSTVDQVAGRFAIRERKGHPVRLLLAKNPAGWTAIFDLFDEHPGDQAPVVLSINARVADGLDTSWLWDVPFERLAGRPVVATGDRRRDLALRLRYAEVDYTVVDDPLAAVDRAIRMRPSPVDGPAGSEREGADPIDLLGNYTAFAELWSRL